MESPLPVSFQWQRADTNLLGATNSFLSLSEVSASDAGTYSLVATSPAGSVTSSPAILTVLLAPEIYWPVSAITVSAGDSYQLGAILYGEPPFFYEWRKGTLADSVLLSTNRYHPLTNIQASAEGAYFLMVSNVHGTDISYPAYLRLWPPPPLRLPEISVQPVGGLFLPGAWVTNSVVIANPQSCSYQWLHNGYPVYQANGSSFVIASLYGPSAGDYQVIISNSQGSVTSAVAQVDILTSPRITTQPASLTAVRGTDVTLFVSAIGGAALSYTWRKNDMVIGGQTNAALVLGNVQLSHAGTYRVDVANYYGTAASSNATLTILAPPLITAITPSMEVPATTSALVFVSADGQQPMTVQLWKDNAPYTGTNFVPDWFQIGGESSLTRRLNLLNAQPGDAGTYQFVITNAHGGTTSAPVVITVGPAPIPPAITQQPADAVVNAGEPASFSVTSSGSAPLLYAWRRYYAPVVNPGPFVVAPTAPDFTSSPTFTLTNVQVADEGLYEVLVRNLGGTVASRVFTLGVRQPLAITGFPASQVVNRGTNLVLSTSAQGTFPLTYQWLKDGTNLPGATNAQLRFSPSFQPRDAGSYQAAVTDGLGNQTNSPTARLFIHPLPGMPGEVDETFRSTQPGGFLSAVLPEADGGLIVAGDFGFTRSGYFGGGYFGGVVTIGAIGASSSGLGVATSPGGGSSGAVVANVTAPDGGSAPLSPGSVNFITSVNYFPAAPATFVTPISRPLLAAEAGLGFEYQRLGGGNGPPLPPTAPLQPASTAPAVVITNPVGIARLRADGSLDTSFPAVAGGVDGSIYALARQADGKILVGGYFFTMNGSNIANLARLNADGSLDTSFQPQPNASVRAILVQPDQRIVIGGVFTGVAGTNAPHLARLHPDGSFDSSFNPGSGPSSYVMALGALADGRIVLGGHFNSYAGVLRARLARINMDGLLDPTFDPGSGPGFIQGGRDLVVLPDGRCYLGGSLNGYQGRYSSVTRILPNGATDTNFPPIQAVGVVPNTSFAVQPGGKVVLAGNFSALNLGSSSPPSIFGRSWIARLNGDGTPDMAFDTGQFAGQAGFLGVWALPSGDIIGSVVGTNPAGYASSLVRLRGHDAPPTLPQILEQPTSQTVLNRGWPEFTVLATGSQPLSYYWQHEGTNLFFSDRPHPWAQTDSKWPYLRVLADERAVGGRYRVVVSNAAGTATSMEVFLHILVPQQMEPPTPLPQGGFRLRFNDYYRRFGASVVPPLPPRFEVYATTNLLSTNWVLLTNVLVGTNGEFSLDDTDATNHPRRFYRILER